jgi:ADP-ribosylglycohydrolase
MKDKQKGALLGLAWGDILGCPVEGWKKHEIELVYGTYRELPEDYLFDKIPDNKKARLRPLGFHSDDTQQALALIYHCLTFEGWNRQAWGQILVQGFIEKAWRGIGRNFVAAVHRLRKGGLLKESGSSSSGIGAAMRVGPLGAIFYRPEQKKQLLQATIESTLMTHADQLAAVFAAVVSYTVSLFIQGFSVQEVWEKLHSFTKEAEKQTKSLAEQGWKVDHENNQLISNMLEQAMEWIDKPIEVVRNQISECARPYLASGFTRAHPNQGFVLLGGLHALLMASRSDLSPHQILISIINEGYDTDTVAAIAGTILGARYGIDWIPIDRFYDRERLLKYADALVDQQIPETMSTFLSIEAKLTQMERIFNNN